MKIQKFIKADNYDKEKLKKEFGKNKHYPQQYELPILITLSYFPELKDTKISFIERKSEFAFSSRPIISSMLRSTKLKEYEIIISSQSSKVPNHLLFHHLPLSAQVGVLGHELSHTIYYLNKNIFHLMFLGVKYLLKKFRINFERETDYATINRGLGYQLLEFATYNRQTNSTSELIKWLNTYYLTPEDILHYMSEIPEYKL